MIEGEMTLSGVDTFEDKGMFARSSSSVNSFSSESESWPGTRSPCIMGMEVEASMEMALVETTISVGLERRYQFHRSYIVPGLWRP